VRRIVAKSEIEMPGDRQKNDPIRSVAACRSRGFPLLAILAASLLWRLPSAAAQSRPVAPSPARPTPAQLAWHDSEIGMFIHFAPNTFTNLEYDDLTLPLDRFNPAQLDTDDWVAAAEALDAKYIILVAKHAGGFCLWPTETTDYSIRNTPWRAGKGDIVADLAESCRKRKMRLGVYLSPTDKKQGAGGGGRCQSPADQQRYNDIYRRQLTEVLTTVNRTLRPTFGDAAACEVWFDGSVVVPVGDILEKLAPQAMVFQGPHATIRWVGNEDGVAPYPAWNSLPEPIARTGEATAEHGDPAGAVWMPLECDARMRNTWFWNDSNAPALKPLAQLMDMYDRSVGHGAVLLLNQTPDVTGRIPPADVARGAEFAAEIRRRFGKPLAETNGTGETIILPLARPAEIDHVILMEDIAQGERVRRYVLEGRTSDGWQNLSEGTAIGHKRIDRFAPRAIESVRLRVLQSAGEPRIRRFAAFFVGSTTSQPAKVR
jgi:alpha-L-fucosidase